MAVAVPSTSLLQRARLRTPTGHIVRLRGSRGDVWYAKYRLPDGRQVKRRIGPAWTERGRPGRRVLHQAHGRDWLADVLDQARRGELPGMVRTGATFEDAVAEYMRWLELDRQRKPSTLRDYESIVRAHLLPAFGEPAAGGHHDRPGRSAGRPSSPRRGA